MRHQNNGLCPKCHEIIDKYPGFDPRLKEWFMSFQLSHHEAHTSCAGRGFLEQEELYARRASNARYGQSSHNYNAALDIFEMSGDLKNIYEPGWFVNVLAPELPSWIEWYGRPQAVFYELPHIQLKNWKAMRDSGKLVLVEPIPIVVT